MVAYEGVPAAQVRVEERQRLAGRGGGKPERDLGQLDRHRIEVDAVDAAFDDQPPVGGAFVVVELVVDVLAGAGQGLAVRLGEPVDRRDEEPARAHGRVADAQAEDLLGCRLVGQGPQGLADDEVRELPGGVERT